MVPNTYGTVRWRCFVCETVGPGDEAERVPFVIPAARVLLSTKGAAQSRLFLAWLALITEQGVDPLVAPRICSWRRIFGCTVRVRTGPRRSD